jgi:hypothetical protein
MKNKNVHRLHDNIYITSNEKPKEGDWYLDKYNNIYYLVTKVESNGDGKKIILATDQDLIKDGVQAIDDEFLEWFIKNPSCEEVEVETTRERNGYHSKHKKRYKIIIPQEEPKQRLDCPYDFTSRCTMGNCDCKPKQEELKFKNRQIGAAGFVANQIMENMIDKPKLDTVGKEFYENADMTITVKRQETLEEEASQYYAHNYFDMHETNNYKALRQGFEAGSKWQAERMYSKEEVRKIAEEVRWQAIGNPLEFTKNFEKWFEQFKKK